uniref:VWFA and cache domain-containing protein 1-like n=1 Tax=Saccoglossus kowalevskii TaxID=10224 RepID=A0ABM0M935_SACKO|nr:PREDICTED: VWFA and cache domain-containing protein 1-like [Saccoglossus kowalevskii]
MAENKLTVLSVLITVINLAQASALLDVTKLSEELAKVADNNLGVTVIQEQFNSLAFENIPLDNAQLIEQLLLSVSAKFQSGILAVENLREAVQDSLASSSQGTFTECCQLDPDQLEYRTRFRKRIDEDIACERLSSARVSNPKRLNDGVIDVMKSNYQNPAHKGIQWQFYGSEEGVFTIYPANSRSDCNDYDARYRPWYVETATSDPKNVVILIDNSGSMSHSLSDGRTFMETAKEAANTVLDTMNPNDKVSVIAFSTELRRPGEDSGSLSCFKDQLAEATPPNIDYLKSFVHSIPTEDNTNYIGALNAAFDLLKGSMSTDENRKQVILFLTDGQPTDNVGDDDERRRRIMQTIIDRNNDTVMNNKVIIFTYGLGGEVDAGLLKAMALQDGSTYGVGSSGGDIEAGKSVIVSNPDNLRIVMASYYDQFSSTSARIKPIFSVPYQAASGNGLMTTVALPVIYNGGLEGVVGVDITLQDIFDEISYFHQGQLSYAFIFESSSNAAGRTLIHPLLPAPINVEEDPVFVHITSLERASQFKAMIEDAEIEGDSFKREANFSSTRSIPRGNSATEGVRTQGVLSTYTCEAIGGGTPYVLCLVVADSDIQTELNAQTPTGNDFVYHRADLRRSTQECRHFNRRAITEQSSVKFSPEAFVDPQKYLSEEEDVHIVQAYTNYMNDVTGTVQSDKFKPGVRDAVVVTAAADEVWKQSLQSETKQYTAFYYIGTSNGVFREYPGVQLNHSYDHTVRSWYERAKSNKGMRTLSPPYDAASGSGYVITLSHTLVDSLLSNEVVAVMGMDFTLAYFYRVLTELYPLCMETQYSCFVMDSSGYLVVHQDFFGSSGIDIHELHITQLEPDVAQHLITEGVLTKEKCVKFQKIKLQNYYVVPKSSNNVVDNLEDANPCMRYQLSYIPMTNAYLGIIDKSGRCLQSLCPCLESNCQHAGEDKCECPCDSDAAYDHCDNEFQYTSDTAPSCTPPVLDIDPIVEEDSNLYDLSQCFAFDCNVMKNAIDCESVVNCEWCDEGENIDDPYCSDKVYYCKPAPLSSPSAGAVVGAVIGVLLVIAIVVVVIVVIMVLRRRHKDDYSENHMSMSYTASAQPSAPPPPSAPRAPESPHSGSLGSDINMLPDSPAYINPESNWSPNNYESMRGHAADYPGPVVTRESSYEEPYDPREEPLTDDYQEIRL